MTAPSGSELRFDGQSLNDFAARIFRALGMPEEDANITADVLANANLRGVDTHGLDMLPIYVDRLRQGVINPCPAVRKVRQGPSMAVLDAGRAAGQVGERPGYAARYGQGKRCRRRLGQCRQQQSPGSPRVLRADGG